MAITITANLDASGVKTGAAQVANAVEGMAGATEAASQSMANEILDSRAAIMKLQDEVDDLKTELDRMAGEAAESFDQVEDGAQRAGEAVDQSGDRMAGLRDRVKTVGVAFLAVSNAVKSLSEIADKAGQAIESMAETGNPAAVELRDSIQGVKAELLAIAEDPVFQKFMEGLSDEIEQRLIPAIKAIPDVAFESLLQFRETVQSVKESIGLASDGSTDMMRQMFDMARSSRDMMKEAAEAQKQDREAKQRLAKVDEDLAKLEEQRRQERVRGNLALIDSEAKLSEMIRHQTEIIRQRAKEGKLSDDEREAGLQNIRLAEDRLKQLRAEAGKAETKATEARIELRKVDADDSEMRARHELDRVNRLNQAKLEAERRNIEARKRLVTGSDIDGAKGLIEAQSREQVRQAFANNQGNAAAQEAARTGGDADDIAKARQRATELARRQFDKGQADPEEVRKAQVEFANATINAGQKQGKISADTAQAMREGLQELANNANELDQVRDEVEQLKKLTRSVVLQGQRRRAQIAGAGR